MKKVEAIVRPSKLEELKDALIESNITGITISQVLGCGQQMGWTENYRSSKILINVLPKVQIKIVVTDDKVDEVVDLIVSVAKTNEVGGGKIFITDIDDCIRIRTGDRGEKAI